MSHPADTLGGCARCAHLHMHYHYILNRRSSETGGGTVKFRCDRDALSNALQTVQRGVSSRPGIPALTGVLIEAEDGGRLTLTTTDLEVSARLSIDVRVQEPGI